MDDRWVLSRRQLLKTLVASGVVAAGDLAWWEEPLVGPRRAWGAQPVRFQFSVPEPKRTALVESLAQRFNQSQKDFEVRVEFVPQAQARQKLITSIAANNPPDCCQVWDNWVGEFDGMNAVEDLTPKVRDWSGYKDVLPLAWETVTVKKRILSFPWVVTNDGVYWRTDRAKEYGARPPKDDWNFDDFLAWAKTMTKPEKTSTASACAGRARGPSSTRRSSCTPTARRCSARTARSRSTPRTRRRRSTGTWTCSASTRSALPPCPPTAGAASSRALGAA